MWRVGMYKKTWKMNKWNMINERLLFMIISQNNKTDGELM